MNREQFYALGPYHSYACFAMLIFISVTNTMQRSAITFMYGYQTQDQDKYEDPHYNIRNDIRDMNDNNFGHIAGDSFTIFYAFMVLLTGAASDLMNRKLLLLGSCFGWCLCTYLSSFVTSFNQLYILRILMAVFNAASGPCSYSLITDWIPPEHRVMAYSVYALGVQFGGPLASFNTPIIEWLGWRGTFQYLALIGFVTLAISIVLFDEPERGRFDIA
jgi:MFS family permease